jgi:hypothetical protein
LLVKMLDAPSFLWRAELAGHPRDTVRWKKVHEFAHRSFPNPGVAFVDWHVALADAVAGDDIERERGKSKPSRSPDVIRRGRRFPQLHVASRHFSVVIIRRRSRRSNR